jgi:RNA polymerase sigma factor (sigma-70 family)
MAEDLSFAELMAKLQAGDQDAATRVFKEYADRLIGLARGRLSERARRKVGDEAVVQSALLSFFTHHTGEIDLQSEDSLWTNLLAITLRHCGKWNKRFRAKKRAGPEAPLQVSREGADAGLEPSAEKPTPEMVVTLVDLVEHLMAGLTERQRQVVELRLQDVPVAEICRQVGLSQARVYRILEEVREYGRARLAQLDA